MLVERYEHVNLFDLVPPERDAILDEMDQVLDAVSQWFTAVRTRKKSRPGAAHTRFRR
jgi:hypothetical protein